MGVSKAEVHTSKTLRSKGNLILVNLTLDYVAYIKVPVDLDINCTFAIMLTRNKTQAHQSLLNQDASFQQSLRSFSINAILDLYKQHFLVGTIKIFQFEF